jgi:hypothetical protein
VKRCFAHRCLCPLWLIGLFLFLFSCNLLDRADDLQATISAVHAQQTRLVQTATALAARNGPQTTPQPPTPAANATAQTPSPAAPTLQASAIMTVGVDEERLLKSAKILLFEDMSASRYIRLVKEALDEAGYFYIDVGSAKGWFKSQLLSGVEWNLVIAAAEAEREFGGEFFEYLKTQLERGAAVIIENWDLDSAPLGRARPLLDACGVSVQSDWYEPEMRVFYWTEPAHPIFNYPNRLTSGLRNAVPIWRGDVGDLLQARTSAGEPADGATLLASVNRSWMQDHGLLVSCMDGRMILQTFRSHEYHHDDMVALWQNYVYYALKSHFAYTLVSLPTPAATFAPLAPPLQSTPAAPTPGPDYTLPHACGEAFSVRLSRAPIFQKDLFEHHALGTFLILRLELVNQSAFPIQVWDGDYFLQGEVNGKTVTYTPHIAATGYLYISQPSDLYQDLIQPGETLRASIAFDVAPQGERWRFIFRPGSEFDEQVCEVSLPLDR